MMRVEVGLALPIIYLLVVGCGNPTGAENQAALEVSGSIKSAEDQAPLPDIVVEVWAGSWWNGDSRPVAQATSDPEGMYSFKTPRVPCDEVVLQVSLSQADGYTTAVSTYISGFGRFSRELACTDEAQVLDITLLPDSNP